MGATLSVLLQQTFPPKSKFSVEDIPDLTGKVAIVTGANTGVGKETAKALLHRNAKVYIAARNQEKAESAINDLKVQTGKEAQFLKLDLADLYSVKAAAAEFQSKEKELHMLFNNGGVMIPPIEMITSQAYDLQFGTNVLGHFYFTKLLLPTLISTAKCSSEGNVRVVNTSSSAHVMGSVDFNALKEGPVRRKKNPGVLYAQSKLGNVIFANELGRRYGDQGVVSTSCNPGNLHSDLQRYMPKWQAACLAWFLYPASYGALTQLYAGTSQEGANFNRKYLIPWARIGPMISDAEDLKLGEELWKWLEEQVESI